MNSSQIKEVPTFGRGVAGFPVRDPLVSVGPSIDSLSQERRWAAKVETPEL
jgi:hypothetical protein